MKEIIKQLKKHGYDYEIENGKLMVLISWVARGQKGCEMEWFEVVDLMHFNVLDHWGPTLRPGVWDGSRELQGY
jgi:hypothetical protein